MTDVLAHPMIILLVGAALTGLIIPLITRRWQDRQKALELKTELVSELSQAIMEIVLSVQFVKMQSQYMDQEKLDQAYLTWETRSAVIGTKLQAYFPETTIPGEWTRFSEVVTNFYALVGMTEEKRAVFFAETTRLLATLNATSDNTAADWQTLREGILNKKADLIQQVLKARITVLSR